MTATPDPRPATPSGRSFYAFQPLPGSVGFSEVVTYAKAWNTTDRATGVAQAPGQILFR